MSCGTTCNRGRADVARLCRSRARRRILVAGYAGIGGNVLGVDFRPSPGAVVGSDGGEKIPLLVPGLGKFSHEPLEAFSEIEPQLVSEKLFVFDYELQVVLEDPISLVNPVHWAETAELARFISRVDELARESVTESVSKRRGISRESAARILFRFEIATSVKNTECQDFIR